MTQTDYLSKMNTWSFIKENDARIYSAQGLNFQGTGTLQRLLNMKVGDQIEVYGKQVKRV